MRSLYRSLVPTLLLALAACAGRGSLPESGPGAPAPAAAVERFLQLAAEREYAQMGWVFGTEDGPIIRRDPESEVERRMYALASVLEHESYVVGPSSPVPGRSGRAIGLRVSLRKGSRSFEVPFVAVRGSDDRWYVEQVGVEAITDVR